MTDDQKLFLQNAARSARDAAHIFPEMAACEAALESAYGRSLLALQDNNLFGMKQHKHPIYGTHTLPTREFEGKDGWVVVQALWVHYPGWATCFFDRMSTLHRLADVYPHYAAALAAKDPLTYITEVSQNWSTDPARAEKVKAIYHDFLGEKLC